VERSVEVDTGESVAFRYDLAGLGSRFLAVLFDILIQLTIAAGLTATFLLIVSTTSNRIGALPSKVRSEAGSILIAAFIVLAFLLFFGYFILFEWLWNGKTPGKRIVGIRVVRDGGFPVDFIASTARNLVRILEFGAGFYAFSAISTLLSPLNRRLGDYAAGTIVVRDGRYERTAYAPGQAAADPVLRDLSLNERELILRYAERRSGLAPGARAELADAIAGRIRPRLAASFEHLDDDTLLEHLAGLRSPH
jgi:uncharacterized RDD family membrane protein YckC